MTNIIETIMSKKHLYSLSGASLYEIKDAQQKLGVNFAKEYIDYISRFGIVSYEGHELTGICKANRLNVVNETLYHRKINPSVPRDWYVIEDTNMDGIVIWQNEEGEIFETGNFMMKICNSLSEYINL